MRGGLRRDWQRWNRAERIVASLLASVLILAAPLLHVLAMSD
jgi:hypothetical protein